MRIKLDTGGITNQDNQRGIGVYAEELSRRLPQAVEVVDQCQQLTHHLVFKIFSPQPLSPASLVTIHDLIPLKYPQAYPPGIRGRLLWWLNRRYLRQAAGVITDSLASKRDIIHLTAAPAEKVYVIYLAADEIFKPGKAENKYKLPQKFILYVGGLNWNKNVVSLTKTCLAGNYSLVVIGRQALEEDYPRSHPETRELVRFQRLAKAHPKKIIRLGSVTDQDLAAIYNLATVYVQPSRDEGFGLPVLEALSCGCPVLSSGKGSLPEITGKAALPFNRKNLKLVWQDEALRRQLSQAGLSQAKKFSWKKTVRETVKVYEKVITDRSNR